jgi:hypothetical protein
LPGIQTNEEHFLGFGIQSPSQNERWATRVSAEAAAIKLSTCGFCRLIRWISDFFCRYFIRRRDTLLGLQFVVSGEHKDVDRFRGQAAEDTGITSVFLGPRVIAAFGKISAEIAVDLPVSIDNTALQVVPDYRIRGGIAIRF